METTQQTLNHTAGPWRIETRMNQADTTGTTITAVYEVEGGVCSKTQQFYCITSDAFAWGDREADARLIAASPDLLALANRVANLNEHAGEIGAGMLASLIEDARIAIAKAMGTESKA